MTEQMKDKMGDKRIQGRRGEIGGGGASVGGGADKRYLKGKRRNRTEESLARRLWDDDGRVQIWPEKKRSSRREGEVRATRGWGGGGIAFIRGGREVAMREKQKRTKTTR